MSVTTIGVGILVHNAIQFRRLDLFEETYASVKKAFPTAKIVVLDNGSTDGTDEVVAELAEGTIFKTTNSKHLPGVGQNMLMALLGDQDVYVLSDDDMRWKPEAEERLATAWNHAPDDLALMSGYLEPCWDWNTPRERLSLGGVPVLVRDSVPGCAWTFPRRFVSSIIPIDETGFGQDARGCAFLRASGLRMAGIDLAEHLGWDFSTWGNEALAGSRPLNRKAWDI